MQSLSKVILFLTLITIGTAHCFAQVTNGKIVYERKTNLYKKLSWAREWIKEGDRTKVDEFELFFNDSMSVFKPRESDLKENFSWATEKNSVYQNMVTNSRYSIKMVWGEGIHVTDTLYKRDWKITDSKRNISGYMCRKAVWEADDTTRIYAWYCDEISMNVGPESFYGLPGAILGLATEDGGVIYFAKSVEVGKQDESVFRLPKAKKIYTPAELKFRLEKEYGKEKWGKAMIKNLFGYW